MKSVFTTLNDVPLLNRLKEALELKGIACIARNLNGAGAAAGEVVPILLWPELLVMNPLRYDEAKAIVDEITSFSPRDAAPWKCGCGEELDSVFGACWNCGSAKPEG